MDLQMPGMDGLEATRRIRARERAQGGGHVAIIALTADVIAGTRQQCFALLVRPPKAAKAKMSLRPAFVLAVLLSLTCSAVAGRHLLQTANTFYHATSSMTSTGKMTASLTLDANVTTTYQVTNFTIRISGAPVSSATTITNPRVYTYGTGATVAEFSCTFTADLRTSIYTCNVVEKVSLTYASKPVGTLKALIDAGLLKSPPPLLVSVQVSGVTTIKGTLSATATSY
ncbi:unnamed protein product [Closterium sp. Yama58-4]|nr:unnamed protein product [Closterium sp. Yama58-4]